MPWWRHPSTSSQAARFPVLSAHMRGHRCEGIIFWGRYPSLGGREARAWAPTQSIRQGFAGFCSPLQTRTLDSGFKGCWKRYRIQLHVHNAAVLLYIDDSRSAAFSPRKCMPRCRRAQLVVLVVGRRGMVVPVQLGAESSCVCITAAILTILPLSWN